MYKIVVVDDEVGILKAVRRELADPEYEIETYASPLEALSRLQHVEADLVISDFRMPEMDGATFLTKVKIWWPMTMRVVLSGHAELKGVLSAVNNAEIYRFVLKPWNQEELCLTVTRALEHRNVLLENKRLADEVRAGKDQIVRQEKALKLLREQNPDLAAVNWDEDGSIIVHDG